MRNLQYAMWMMLYAGTCKLLFTLFLKKCFSFKRTSVFPFWCKDKNTVCIICMYMFYILSMSDWFFLKIISEGSFKVTFQYSSHLNCWFTCTCFKFLRDQRTKRGGDQPHSTPNYNPYSHLPHVVCLGHLCMAVTPDHISCPCKLHWYVRGSQAQQTIIAEITKHRIKVVC